MKRFEAIFMIVVLVAVLVGGYYAIAQAIGINRTYGGNTVAGWGLRLSADDPDTIKSLVNGTNGLKDSLVMLGVTDSTTALKIIGTGARVWGGMTFGPVAGNRLLVDDTLRVTKRLAFTGSAAELYLPVDAITNTMTATIDSGWITDASLGWRLCSQPLKDSIQAIRGSTATFLWRVNGGSYTVDSMSAAGIPPIFLVHTALTGHDSLSVGLKIGHGLGLGTNNDSVAVKFGAGLGLVSESLAVKDGFGLLIKTGDSLAVDTTQLKTLFTDPNYITDGGGEINATGDFNFTSAVKITNLVADSCDAFWGLSAIDFPSTAFELFGFSLGEGITNSISIYFPIRSQGANSDTVFEWCIKHTTNASSGNDQYDTVCYSGMVGYVKDSVTIDSLSFNIKTSSTTNTVTSVKALLIRHTKGSGNWSDMKIKSMVVGDTTAQLASTTANGWAHQRFTSLATKVITGDRLAVWFQVRLDPSQTVYHDNPVLWFKHNN